MTRSQLAVRRVSVPALAVLALASLALFGCGDGSRTNGLETLPARTAQQKALAALRSASSAHVKGTSLVAGHPAKIDVRFSGPSSSGVIASDGLQFAFIRISDTTYIKAGRRVLKQLGAPAPVRRVAAGRWLRLTPEQVTLSGISLGEIVAQLADDESALEPDVGQETLDGRPVVVVTRQNGSKLYISNTGPAYPLRGDYSDPAAARFDFTEFGAELRVTAPEHPLDAGALGIGE